MRRAVRSTDENARVLLQAVGKRLVAEWVQGAVVVAREVEMEVKVTREKGQNS